MIRNNIISVVSVFNGEKLYFSNFELDYKKEKVSSIVYTPNKKDALVLDEDTARFICMQIGNSVCYNNMCIEEIDIA